MVARYDRPMQSAGGPDGRLLVVVSGSPGSGKTTLAGRLSEELGLMLLAKDQIKEALAEAVGYPDDVAASARLGHAAYAATFALAERTVASGKGVILESNFRRGTSEPEIAAIAGGSEVRLIHCSVPPEVARLRYGSRFKGGERHPAHLDAEGDEALAADLADGRYEPIELGCPTLTVDTSSGYRPALETILAFVAGGAR